MKNYNSKFKNRRTFHFSLFTFHSRRSGAGFTLIEIIVSIALSGLIILGATSLLFSLFKSGGKSEALKEIKQNGDYAIFVMSEMIRNASSLTCGESCQTGTCVENNITIKNPDGNFTTFECLEELVGGIKIAKIASGGAALTGSNVTLGDACPGTLSFSCSFSSVAPPIATIRFTLSQVGTPTRPEEKATSSFQTTVSLRTY